MTGAPGEAGDSYYLIEVSKFFVGYFDLPSADTAGYSDGDFPKSGGGMSAEGAGRGHRFRSPHTDFRKSTVDARSASGTTKVP